jgi:hypothetical protein
MDADAYEAGIVEAYESELRKKDSEIEGLKALITELADALIVAFDVDYADLVKRAREATR